MSSKVTSYCLKVSSPHYEWSFTQPHLSHATEEHFDGTIFFLKGKDVGLPERAVVGITNYHVVETNCRHRCRVYSADGSHMECLIIYVCPQLDFAIVEAPDNQPTGTLCTDASLAPGEPVMVPGYPLETSCDSCQFTYGAMSAPIDNQWLQCSMSCNHGNSGGPLLSMKDGLIHGICTASPLESEGITWAIPIGPVCTAVRRWARSENVIIRLPRLMCKVQKMTEARAQLNGIAHKGVYIENFHKNCPLSVLRKGDVLLSVNGMPLNTSTGKVENAKEWDLRLDGETSWLLLPEKFPITYLRQGVKGKITSMIDVKKVNLTPLRTLYPLWEPIPTLSIGGAVCVPLCKNVLDEFEGYDSDERVRACWNLWDNRHTVTRDLVVVVFVEPHSYADECGICNLMVFKKVNGRPISTVYDILGSIKQKRGLKQRAAIIEFYNAEVAVNTKELSLNPRGAGRMCPRLGL